jgi:heme-based aerotactic transducer
MHSVTHRTVSGVTITYRPYPPEKLARQLAFTEITQEDLTLIAGLRDLFLARVPVIVKRFYDHLWTIPELREVVQKYSSIEKLSQTLAEYLRWLVRGKVDQEYADYRYRVGAVHEKIGLGPHWYLGMFHLLEAELVALVREYTQDQELCDRICIAFLKLLSLDMQLALDAYIEAYTAERTSRLEKLQELQRTLITSSQGLAASAEESSASAEEMAAAVSHVASDAEQVARQSDEIRRSAEEGARRIQQVAETIRQVAAHMNSTQEKVALLAESSRQMEKIVRTVDGIAKQTNLLSLNAAIEAARAGVHGRGFAVVAEEVRNLSNRTSASLREISQLIANSNSAVDMVRETTAKAGAIAGAGAADTASIERDFAEIVRLVTEGAERINAITRSLQELAQLSDNVRAGAEANAHLATTLAQMAQGE